MDALLQRLALLARTEALAIRIRAKQAARTAAFSAAAFVAAVLAFGLINLCAFNLIAAAYTETTAAMAMAGFDALLALILLLLARRRTPTAEEAMVNELRELALAQLADDATQLKAQLAHLQLQVTQIGESISRVAKADPLQLGLASVGPILSMASRFLDRKKDA